MSKGLIRMPSTPPGDPMQPTNPDTADFEEKTTRAHRPGPGIMDIYDNYAHYFKPIYLNAHPKRWAAYWPGNKTRPRRISDRSGA
jgi:hypothetical protein